MEPKSISQLSSFRVYRVKYIFSELISLTTNTKEPPPPPSKSGTKQAESRFDVNQLEYRDNTEIKTNTHTYNQSQRLDVKREPRMRRTQPPAWTMRKKKKN